MLRATTVPYGHISVATVPYGHISAATVPYGHISATTVPYGHISAATVPYGHISATTVPYGHISRHSAVRTHISHHSAVRRHISNHTSHELSENGTSSHSNWLTAAVWIRSAPNLSDTFRLSTWPWPDETVLPCLVNNWDWTPPLGTFGALFLGVLDASHSTSPKVKSCIRLLDVYQ